MIALSDKRITWNRPRKFSIKMNHLKPKIAVRLLKLFFVNISRCSYYYFVFLHAGKMIYKSVKLLHDYLNNFQFLKILLVDEI